MTEKKKRDKNSKAGRFNSFGHTMHDVVIKKQGTEQDCVHHEVITALEEGNLYGVCNKCGQERLYESTLLKKMKNVSAV